MTGEDNKKSLSRTAFHVKYMQSESTELQLPTLASRSGSIERLIVALSSVAGLV